MSTIPIKTRLLPDGRRVLGAMRGACTVCDADVRLIRELPGRNRTRLLIGVHGPKAARCPGSRVPGKPWAEACRLPTWEDMTDHDKGQALTFEHKAFWERSFAYARNNYPPKYTDPRLTDLAALDPTDYYPAIHASSVVRSLGTPLVAVPNPWADTGDASFRPEPATIPEPVIWMARRVLGDAEVDRLMEATATN